MFISRGCPKNWKHVGRNHDATNWEKMQPLPLEVRIFRSILPRWVNSQLLYDSGRWPDGSRSRRAPCETLPLSYLEPMKLSDGVNLSPLQDLGRVGRVVLNSTQMPLIVLVDDLVSILPEAIIAAIADGRTTVIQLGAEGRWSVWNRTNAAVWKESAELRNEKAELLFFGTKKKLREK